MTLIRNGLRECRNYLEYFAIPAMAIVMPWWLAIRFFRAVAYLPWLYRNSSLACLNGARHLGLSTANGMSEAQWLRACKIGQIIDYADIFLIFAGRQGYWHRHIDENIKKNLEKQQIIFTPHYGAGMWIYWYLQKQACQAVMFVNLPEKNWSAHHLLGRFRLWLLRRLGAKIISPDNLLALREVLRNGDTILVGPDMPVLENVAFYTPKTFLGRLNLTARFFDLAEKRGLPVLNIVFAADIMTGKRHFEAQRQQGKTAAVYAQAFAEQTALAIQKRPYLWRMMVMAPQVMLPLEENLEVNSKPN